MTSDANQYEHDAFISHASEDKDVVRPLARELEDLGLDVWYDEDEILVGDSIRESIDDGLRVSDYGVVVLSEAFFDTEWTEYELNALVSRQHEEDGKVILPLWYGIGKEFLVDISPALADMRAEKVDEDTVSEAASKLAEVIQDDAEPGDTREHWDEVTGGGDDGTERSNRTDRDDGMEGNGTVPRGYLSPVESKKATVKKVLIEESVGVFRRDESGDDSVLAETDGQTIELGLRDRTVSRKSDGVPPVEFVPRSGGILVRNVHNENDVDIHTGIETIELDAGSDHVVDRDCTVSIGFNTDLLLTIEDEPSEERDGRRTISTEEYKEQLGLERDGAVMGGVGPAAHAEAVGERVRTQVGAAREASDAEARTDALNECLIYAQELRDFFVQWPLDSSVYEEVFDDVEGIVDDLECVLEETVEDESSVDWRLVNQVQRVTKRVEGLYAREG